MPFPLSQTEAEDIHRTLKRGRPSFAWTETSLLALLSPPTRTSDVYWATIGLRDCGTAASVPALKALADFPNQDIRACAMLTLGQIRGAAETPYYAQCLLDPGYRAKDYALWAIGEFGDERALPAVETYTRKNRKKLGDLRGPPQSQMEILAYLFRHAATHPQALALLREFSFLLPPLRTLGDLPRARLLARCPGISTILPGIDCAGTSPEEKMA